MLGEIGIHKHKTLKKSFQSHSWGFRPQEKKFNRPLGKCKYISTLREDCVILDQPVEFNLNL